MPISVTCLRCRAELEESGGLLFSPPLYNGVVKDHLCATCYQIVRDWILFASHILPEGSPDSLTYQIEKALLARHPVTLHPQRARNYAELAAFVANGGY